MTIPPLLSNLYSDVVLGREKAAVAFAVVGLTTFVAQHFGYHVSNGLQQSLTALLLALLAHFSVYLTTNQKP